MYRGQGGEFTISVPVGPERFHYLTSCASGREKARGGGGGGRARAALADLVGG